MEKNPFTAELKPEIQRKSVDYQTPDIVTAKEIKGFKDIRVAVTLEKKQANQNTSNKNQDNVLADPFSGLCGVFDGLGDGNNPDGASRIAALVLSANWELACASKKDALNNVKKYLDKTCSESETEKILTADLELVKKANALLILFHLADQAVSDVGGMTTACVGFIHISPDGNRYLVTANVGDSGAFILRDGEQLKQATSDDSCLSWALREKIIDLPLLHRMKFDPTKEFNLPSIDEKSNYLKLSSTILRPLGIGITAWAPKLDPRLSLHKLKPKDSMIFCTDGIIDKYEKEVKSLLPPEEMTAEQLDLKTFTVDATDGATFIERANNLRQHAGFRMTRYKRTDDSAIVWIKMPDTFKQSGK